MFNHPKRLKYYGLFFGIAIFLILATPVYSFTEPSPSPSSPICTEESVSIDCLPIIVMPSPSPSPSPSTDPEFKDTTTNVKAAVIFLEASERWGSIIYPGIYATQIIALLIRHI